MNSTYSRLRTNPNAVGATCFTFGYYFGQVLLWLAGLKGIPKVTYFQAVNAVLVWVAGYLLCRMLLTKWNSAWTALLTAMGLSIIKFFLVSATDVRASDSSLAPFLRNLSEFGTSFFMLTVASLLCYYGWYKTK